MKLIYCKLCRSARSLAVAETAYCDCQKSWGVYEDDGRHATYGGEAVPLEFDNGDFRRAVRQQSPSGLGHLFTAFVIAKKCETFKREKRDA